MCHRLTSARRMQSEHRPSLEEGLRNACTPFGWNFLDFGNWSMQSEVDTIGHSKVPPYRQVSKLEQEWRMLVAIESQ